MNGGTSVKPGVCRSTSSKAPAALFANSADDSTVALAAPGRRVAPRSAVTTTESAKLAGWSTKRRGVVVAGSNATLSSSKPSARIRSVPALATTVNVPSSARATGCSFPSATRVTVASGTAAPERSTTAPRISAGACSAVRKTVRCNENARHSKCACGLYSSFGPQRTVHHPTGIDRLSSAARDGMNPAPVCIGSARVDARRRRL